MVKTIKPLAYLTGVLLGITLLIYLPYLLKVSFYGLDFGGGVQTIYKNFDGLEYIVIAKSLYSPALISHIPQNLPASYFASHFPLYPIFIALIAPLFGFLKSMIFISSLFTLFSVWAFYLLVKDFKLTNSPLWLSILFLVLPARWLIVHSIGSSEPVLIFFLMLSLYSFLKFENLGKHVWIWLAGIFGALAVLTRPPAILLFISYCIFIPIFHPIKNHLKYFVLGLMPIALLGVFYLFSIQYGDFFAYFHSGDNIHLTLPPFQVFNKGQFWVGDIWLEDIVYVFLLGFLGGLYLIRQKLYPLGIFVLTFLSASILVAHRDISRYTLPIMPFLLIAFEKVLTSREFKIAFAIVALGIYLYTQNFLLHNTAPIPNLSTFN